MSSFDIELILSRQLAESLRVPTFITDPRGNLVFYNESAGKILGRGFSGAVEMPADKWGEIFKPLDDFGEPIAVEDLPVLKVLHSKMPSHKDFWIRDLEDNSKRIGLTSYPVIGRGERFLGAVAIFWPLS